MRHCTLEQDSCEPRTQSTSVHIQPIQRGHPASVGGKNDNRSEGFEEITGKLGIARQEVLDKHFEVYGRMLDSHQLRQQILPMLETAGLIVQEQDPSDKRKIMIFRPSCITILHHQIIVRRTVG